MRGKVIVEVLLGVSKRNAMVLQQRMHLKARFELEKPPNLNLRQCSGAIRLYCERLQRLSGQVAALAFQSSRDVIG